MNNPSSAPAFHSALAPWIEKFIAEKHACGYQYAVEGEALRRLDRFLCEQGLETVALPRALVERWIAKDPNESPRTQRARIGLVRRLALFLLRQGCPAYVPEARLTAKEPSPFVPYIFRHDEIRRLLEAADTIPVDPRKQPDNMTTLSVSGLLAEAIMNVFSDESVSGIFGGENQLF